MRLLIFAIICALSLPAYAQTAFSTDDFSGSWRIEHYDDAKKTTSLTEVYFDASGYFYSQSLVKSGSKTRYYDSGGKWRFEDGLIRLDYENWSDSGVETVFLQFESFSGTYLSYRQVTVDGEVVPALFEAHRFEQSSFDHGC